MDFSVIYQLRNKRYWWLDVIFYLAVSSLVAAVFCYVIFSLKIGMVKSDIQVQDKALLGVGTRNQQDQEKTVLAYQTKINDFNTIFKNHSFASNVFAFMQNETLPYIWFQQFSLDQKNSTIQLSGQADNMDNFSRQVADFETNKYVSKVSLLDSTVGKSSKVSFDISLLLDPKIFSYLSDLSSLSASNSSISQEILSLNSKNSITSTTSQALSTATTAPAKSSQKAIVLFNVNSNPDITGKINETNHTITVDMPFGIDLTKLITPTIVVSAKASVFPASDTAQDFSTPVTYLVKAEDGTSQNYIATVNVLPNSTANSSGISKYFINVLVILIAIMIVLVVILSAYLIIKKRKK